MSCINSAAPSAIEFALVGHCKIEFIAVNKIRLQLTKFERMIDHLLDLENGSFGMIKCLIIDGTVNFVLSADCCMHYDSTRSTNRASNRWH